jgi:hypothetical protein
LQLIIFLNHYQSILIYTGDYQPFDYSPCGILVMIILLIPEILDHYEDFPNRYRRQPAFLISDLAISLSRGK